MARAISRLPSPYLRRPSGSGPSSLERRVFNASLCPSSGYLTNFLHEGGVPVGSPLIREYQDVFIKVNAWGTFEASDIGNNGCRKPSMAPDVYVA